MRVTVVAKPEVPHQVENAKAMIAGLSRHGVGVQQSIPCPPADTDAVVCWGWRVGERYRAAGHDVLVMERGHVGDRRAFTSCGWNGLGRRGRYVAAMDGGGRWRRHWGRLTQPWRHDTAYALVLGQCAGDAALDRLTGGLDAWAEQTAAGLVEKGWDVVYRPHPLADSGFCPPSATRSRMTLTDDLAGAGLVVSWNSTASVESVLAGVPTVTFDEGAMAWPVTSHDLGEITRPDRHQWCADLAWAQFSLEELASGFAWEMVGGIQCR